MLQSITSALLAIITFLSSIFGAMTLPKVPEDTSDFTPVLRFMAASDSHVGAVADRQNYRVQKAIKMSYAIAEADEEYKELDAVMFAGDLTNDGYKSSFCQFKAATDSVLKGDTQLLAVLAKSHDGSQMDNESLDYYKSITGLDTDYHYVINGYHFIGLSRSKNPDEHYGEYQREWLVNELNKAVADDPNKPIFVTQHEHITGTVYGSFVAWGMDYFKDILQKYPQVVDFSGHSHYPLNDPRSIWQGEFTAIGTGSLCYVELMVEDATVHPTGYESEVCFWIVEVDANSRIRLRGIDLTEEKVLCEYILNNPADTANREFTLEKRAAESTAPVFADGTQAKVSKIAGSYSVKVPAASSTDGMEIFLYRAYVYDADGNEVKSAYTLPNYYSATVKDSYKIKIGKLEKGDYTVKVVAETAYGVQSEPIIVNISK